MAQTEADIEDMLEALRRFDTPKIPPVWTWYGLGPMLADWIGLPPKFLSAVHFQHAPFLDDRLVPSEKRPKPTLVTREQYRQELAALGIPAIHLGTLHVHYRHRQGLTPKPDRAGALFSPVHSTHHIDAVLDHEGMARALSDLPAPYQPAKVLLYWKDMLLGSWKPYLDQGLEVFCAGHMFDPGFVPRLYEILSGSSVVLANYPQTTMMLAVEMGIPAVLFGDEPELLHVTGGDKNAPAAAGQRYHYAYPPGSLVERFAQLLPPLEGTPTISPKLHAFNEWTIGADTPVDWTAIRTFIVRAVQRALA